MTKADKIILWGVGIFSVLTLVFQNVIFADTGKTKIIIEVDGRLYASYETENITTPVEIEIDNKFGYNKIKISKEGACVLASDCEDRACLGKITKNGEFTVCLPHKLIVRAEGIKEVDGVAY